MAKIPGIFERPPNSGVHWISYTDASGMRRREKAGKFSAALDLITERKKQVRTGEYIQPRQTRVWTFRRLAEEAIRHKALRLAPTTIETDNSRLGRLLIHIGSTRFDRLTPQRLEEVLAALKTSGLSGSTVNRFRALISSVFTFAVKTDRIAVNPITRVARYRENDPRVRWMRPEEEARIRKAFHIDSYEWEFELSLLTGMRRGEQFGLQWRNVDLDNGMLEVRGKTGRRHVRANTDAVAALRKLQAISGEREFVCPDNDGKMKRDWRTWFEEAIDEANIKDFHWHDLRHTFASRLVMRGVDIRTVQELLGHKSIVQTMKYAHLSADHRKAAVEKMNVEAAVPA